MKMGNSVDYIIPFAKRRGETSFSSISNIKRLLGTKKVGHSGTLDAFADGLLVVLSGKMTRLASFIEAKTKKYEAQIAFGVETDTLDVYGKPVFTAPLPFYKNIQKTIDKFVGSIMQVPPQFSALHVDGRRAYDLARSGEHAKLLPRSIYIEKIIIKAVLFENDKAFVANDIAFERGNERVKSLHIELVCSKGTYVRSLARDIGKDLASCAHLTNLRRIEVGIFSLNKAFGSELLPEFLSDDATKKDYGNDIRSYALTFSKALCESLTFLSLELKGIYKMSFLQGKNIADCWFSDVQAKKERLVAEIKAFVFCEDEFVGMVEFVDGKYKYKGCFLNV